MALLVKGCICCQLQGLQVVQSYTKGRTGPEIFLLLVARWQTCCNRQADPAAAIPVPSQMYILCCLSPAAQNESCTSSSGKWSSSLELFPWRTALLGVVAGEIWPTKNTNGCRQSRLCIFTRFLVLFCKRNINSTLMAAITIMNVTAGTSSWAYVVGFIFSVDGVRRLRAVAVTVFCFSWGFYFQQDSACGKKDGELLL